jgi:hypothetical protein
MFINGKDKYTNTTLSAFLFSRIGSRVTFDDWKAGTELILTTGGNHDPADIIKAINDVVNSRARKAADDRNKKECDYCQGTGFVSTIDRDGYGYVFGCPDECKGQTMTHRWSSDFEKQGYTRCVVGGRIVKSH